jgi:succinyl-CoA synthetase beta subunit
MEGGVIPLQGLREALEALELASAVGTAWRAQILPELLLPARSHARRAAAAYSLSEAEAKEALADFGVSIPRSRLLPVSTADGPVDSGPMAVAAAAAAIGYPVVIKAVGAQLEHKTEVGGVVLNVRNAADAQAAAHQLARLSELLLVEQMITCSVAEILIGIIVDPQFGLVLVLGAGGILAELVNDSVSLLPPWSPASIEAGLRRLKTWKLLSGYRGGSPADVPALISLILGVTRYAMENIDALIELDVNPVIVGPLGSGAYAVDALIRLRDPLKQTA